MVGVLLPARRWWAPSSARTALPDDGEDASRSGDLGPLPPPYDGPRRDLTLNRIPPFRFTVEPQGRGDENQAVRRGARTSGAPLCP